MSTHGVTASPAEVEFRAVRPTAFPSRAELRQFWDLVRTLAKNEMKQRYFGSVLGYIWSLLRPLMLFGVMYFVFSHVVRVGGDIEHYPLYLLTSIVLWGYFAETTSIGVTSLVARENLMRKINFPRFAIPLSLALTTGIHLLLNLGVVVIFILASGIMPMWSWLEALPLIMAFVAMTLGVAMVLSTLFVKFRDMAPIWEVFSQLLFWGSPIIYVATFPPDSVRSLLAASPLSSTFTELRHAVLDRSAPSAADLLGGAGYVAIPFAIGVFCLLAGLAMFARVAPRVAEEL